MTNRRTGTTGTSVPVSVAPPAGFGPLLAIGYDGRPPAPGPRPRLALGEVRAVTRTAMAVLLVQDDLGGGGVSAEVYDLYRGWYERLSHGAFPSGDTSWQYPPGAGAALLSPALLPWFTYFQAFVTLTLLADAVVTCALGPGAVPSRVSAGQTFASAPIPARAPPSRGRRRWDVMEVTPLGCAVVAARNALLLTAALSCRRLWAGGRPRRELGLHLR